jgi:hypothetical protein
MELIFEMTPGLLEYGRKPGEERSAESIAKGACQFGVTTDGMQYAPHESAVVSAIKAQCMTLCNNLAYCKGKNYKEGALSMDSDQNPDDPYYDADKEFWRGVMSSNCCCVTGFLHGPDNAKNCAKFVAKLYFINLLTKKMYNYTFFLDL